MANLFETTVELLKSEERFCDQDGSLLRNAVFEAAMRNDPVLIRLLLSNEKTKQRFFTLVDKVQVFDKTKFGWLINNRQFLPDSYTRFKNKIGLVDSTGSSVNLISRGNNVELVFPYKDCVLEGGQTKESAKRSEIFYNEALAPEEIDQLLYPKVLVAPKKFSVELEIDLTGEPITGNKQAEEKEVDIFNEKDNLIIKGNNLLVLASLVPQFEGKVDCIYIDPPFNTGKDSFNYNDKFTRSTWLTFMKNRLELARKLLSRTGNIFIHIDINQSHYLKVLTDEVFGNENFVEEIIWAYGSASGGRAATPKPVNIHDYILHYAKCYAERKQKHVYTPYSQKYIDDWFKFVDEDGRKYRRRQRGRDADENPIWERQYLDESKGVPLTTVWTDIQQIYADPRAYKEGNTVDVEVIKEFKGGQKPERLIERILNMSTDEGDLVLDYHLGTGTTAAVAHKMKRQYIGVEQIDSQIEIILSRMKKVIQGEQAGISKELNWKGGGSFVYCELAMQNQSFVEEIEKATDDKTLDQILDRLIQTGFVSYKVDPQEIQQNANLFEELDTDSKKQFLMEILDKNLLYVNFCDIDDIDFNISESDKIFTKSFYAKEVK